MSSTVKNTPEPEGEPIWSTARQELAARLPLSDAAVHQSFAGVDELAALIIESQEPGLPSPRRTKKREAEALLNSVNKRRDLGDGSTSEHRVVGPLDIGHFKVTFHGPIDPECEISIFFTASASTIEAIKEAATKNTWYLAYRLSAPVWRDDKVFVECSIQIPTQYTKELKDIFCLVETLHQASALNRTRRSESSLLDRAATKVGETRLG